MLKQHPLTLPVARPPWTKSGRRLESAVRKALFDFKLLQGADKLLVALSGGKDSLTLLYMLKAILGRGFPNIPLLAAHVSGAFSCGASLLRPQLEKICQELRVPLIVKESQRKLDELECYSCSRERRRLLFEAAAEAGAQVIAFGHHRDDDIETLLLNLLHKGEFAGMLPRLEMQAFGVTIIRPLVYIGEEAICRFAEAHGFARITCRCPVGQRSQRRRVKELIPQLEALFPAARGNLALASRLYGSDKAARRGRP